MKMPLCAVGEVPTRVSRSRGVSPRKRAVRAAYERVGAGLGNEIIVRQEYFFTDAGK